MKHAPLPHLAACLAGLALSVTLPALAEQAAPAAPAAPARLDAGAVNAVGRAGTPARAGIADVLRAQILLDRAHFSPGEIDGVPGANLRAAIHGYQKARGIDGAGSLNAATWSALNADSADALIGYTIAAADVAGPFGPSPEAMADKARLGALHYASAGEALGEKFHASPALLRRLNPGKLLARAGEQIIVPNVQGTSALPLGGTIVVDKSARTVTLFDNDGQAVAQFPASTGSAHDPLPLGNWKITAISTNPVFFYNPKLFWDAGAGDKAAKIPAGPNNPVGVVWINLSKPHYGIHGTPLPALIGKTQSHGCIRLTNWDASTLAAAVAAGTDVVLQDGRENP